MTDDTVDSWEDLEESGLDKQLQNLVSSQSSSKKSSNQCNGVIGPAPFLQEENSGRTAYKPSVRILKREPNSSGNNPGHLASALQSKPVRTLEEREAAYAEARLRILGSSDSSQDLNVNNGEANSRSSGSIAASCTSSSVPFSTVQVGNAVKDSSQTNR